MIFVFGSIIVGHLSDKFGRFKSGYLIGGMMGMTTAFLIIGPSPMFAQALKA
jgi:MFS family permease